MASTSTAESLAIPNHYIVVFKPETPNDKCEAHCAWAHALHCQRVDALSTAEERDQYAGVKSHYRLPNGWAGYSGSFAEALIKEIEDTDEVDYVEPDYKVYSSEIVTDTNAKSWGLARISHNERLTAATQTTYTYDSSAGEGTWAYIIDTGILADHDDFQGRATFGHNAVPGSSNTDKNGHGTHVAGTIGGTTYGVAKKTTLVGVKVLGDDGSGSTSGVIEGLQWAAGDAQGRGIMNRSVANMSLGGSKSQALNSAVASVVRAGMVVCVAAGNSGVDASNESPASEPSAITVGSTNIDDTLSSFSNYGPMVDILAPGHQITSAWIDEASGNSTSITNTISGTSMATPHVVGLCLYLIALEGLSNPRAVVKRLRQLAGSDLISGMKGNTANKLAYNGA